MYVIEFRKLLARFFKHFCSKTLLRGKNNEQPKYDGCRQDSLKRNVLIDKSFGPFTKFGK